MPYLVSIRLLNVDAHIYQRKKQYNYLFIKRANFKIFSVPAYIDFNSLPILNMNFLKPMSCSAFDFVAVIFLLQLLITFKKSIMTYENNMYLSLVSAEFNPIKFNSGFVLLFLSQYFNK